MMYLECLIPSALSGGGSSRSRARRTVSGWSAGSWSSASFCSLWATSGLYSSTTRLVRRQSRTRSRLLAPVEAGLGLALALVQSVLPQILCVNYWRQTTCRERTQLKRWHSIGLSDEERTSWHSTWTSLITRTTSCSCHYMQQTKRKFVVYLIKSEQQVHENIISQVNVRHSCEIIESTMQTI